jgi:N-acetylneuraminate synthase
MLKYKIMTKFIAEVSSNHNGDLSRALKFVDMAKESGFDAVKFQLFRVKELFSEEALLAKPQLLEREQWELPESFIPPLAQRSHEIGIEFSCTPFYLSGIEILAKYCDFLKIASYELLWKDLIRACGNTKLPLILSTGMANQSEVDETLSFIQSEFPDLDLTLLHAVSSYPAPIEDCNLAVIENLAVNHRLKTGWSDHTVEESVIYRAVHRFGASVVEMHVDLDGEGYEFGPGHCWLPERAAITLSNIRNGFRADGDGNKNTAKSESLDRDWRADPFDGLRPKREIRNTLKLTGQG